MSSNKLWIYVIIIIVVLVALFSYPRLGKKSNKGGWQEAGINCLVMGHTSISQHFHSHLEIFVDGTKESIPANIGITGSCMAEIHTHDNSGTIHVEAALSNKEFNLGQLLAVLGQPVQRPGYSLEATVDGQPYPEAVKNLVLKDKQQIVLKYKKTPSKKEIP